MSYAKEWHLMNTKSFQMIKGLTVAMIATLASVASAETLKLNLNPFSNGNGLGGGEFSAVGVSSAIDKSAYNALSLYQGNIETFCLEFNEHFTPGTTYDYSISSRAFGGDVAGGGGDPLSIGTAWLYSQFATGVLSGFSYDYSTPSAVAARQLSSSYLQLAFWYLEDETQFISGYTSYNPATNPFLALAAQQLGGYGALKTDANGAYGVAVLNITSNNGANMHQSQVYLTPSVPDTASTLALLGLAFAGLVAVRRKLC